MKLQNIILPSTDTCTEESMYFRRTSDVYFSWCNDWIDIHPGATVNFDTYFNSFSAEKWFKYTDVKNIFLNLKVKGYVRVTLLRKEKVGNTIHTEYCGEHLCVSTDEPKEFSLQFKTSAVNGVYCFSISGVEGISVFYGAHYSTDFVPTKKVKIAIDICTFKREKFVESNLQLLNSKFLCNKDSFLFDKLEVFVSDNAHTLDIKKLSSDKIHIVQNKNVGGAGGFTRGMIEIKNEREKRGITHILVMDDDLCIEPESIFRTCTILTCIKDQYDEAFIGGAMLRMDRQYFQVESGAVWNGGNLISLKHGLDLRDLDACLFNEFEERAQFNAWWYCVFPASIVRDDNLPMPIFIRGDDVEYGLRNMKHLILMNGICVWHEAFENKYSSFLYYYILRNRLIDNSLHNMVMPKGEFINLLKTQVMDEVRLYRYKNAHLLMKGVEDFFKGASWLQSQDGEKLHKEIMSEGYKLQYIDDMKENVQFLYPLYEESVRAVPATGMKSRIINHYTINGTYLKPVREYNIVPTVGAQQSSVYRTNTVLNYDFSSRKGFVTKRDASEAKKCVKRLNKLCSFVNANYDSAVSNFKTEGRNLMKIDFWNKYLNIEERKDVKADITKKKVKSHK
ncbi:MAG: glycosyltransferase family 2 protein [Ruminococcus sp.]|nr:glycosyltransferase family 2 protein [Ruminococcus sp.]